MTYEGPARGVKTNGIGLVTTSHLNLTVTIAEADRAWFLSQAAARIRRNEVPESKGMPFAGKDQ